MKIENIGQFFGALVVGAGIGVVALPAAAAEAGGRDGRVVLTLEQSVALALTNNPAVVISGAQVDAASGTA